MRLEFFDLLDEIIDLDTENGRIRTRLEVPDESPVFDGHFPGFPLVPGVMLIESMAQASGYMILGAANYKRMPFLAAVKSAKFRTAVLPGQTIEAEAEMVQDGSGYAVTDALIKHNGRTIAESQLTFRVTKFPNMAMFEALADRGRRLGIVLPEGFVPDIMAENAI